MQDAVNKKLRCLDWITSCLCFSLPDTESCRSVRKATPWNRVSYIPDGSHELCADRQDQGYCVLKPCICRRGEGSGVVETEEWFQAAERGINSQIKIAI